MGFSEAFRQLLAEKGMRQADFARATGWSTGYIADKKRAPTREGVSARSVWQPVGGHVSNVMWLVEGTTVMLRVPLAA